MRKTKRWSTLLAAIVIGLFLTRSPRAEAKFENEIGKPGPFMMNLKIGAAIGAYEGGGSYGCGYAGFGCVVLSAFALVLDSGLAVDRDRHAYLLLPLQFEFFPGNLNVIMIPFGFQYEIAIHAVPGLYLYPRFSLGYAAIVSGKTANDGFVMPEFGAKYVLQKRWNFGFEPFSLPIFFGQAGPLVHYRLLWYAGANF